MIDWKKQVQKEKDFRIKEFRRQKKYIKDIQYYLDKAEDTINGVCFKDDAAFESGKGICYISETGLIALQNGEQLQEVFNTKATIKRDIKYYGSRKLKASDIYYEIDWQEPSSLIYEYDY